MKKMTIALFLGALGAGHLAPQDVAASDEPNRDERPISLTIEIGGDRHEITCNKAGCTIDGGDVLDLPDTLDQVLTMWAADPGDDDLEACAGPLCIGCQSCTTCVPGDDYYDCTIEFGSHGCSGMIDKKGWAGGSCW